MGTRTHRGVVLTSPLGCTQPTAVDLVASPASLNCRDLRMLVICALNYMKAFGADSGSRYQLSPRKVDRLQKVVTTRWR